mmetsp:Transcript_71165/g.184770  ORF Transcript_71165/g.184770 Transcript_71165/m.184770 type:complete len:211 (-) Transcript_71165:443-1075(-)
MQLLGLDAELVVMPSSPPSATLNVSPKMKTSTSSSPSSASHGSSGTAAKVGVLGRLPGTGKLGITSDSLVAAEATCRPKPSPNASAKQRGATVPACCWCSPPKPTAGTSPSVVPAAPVFVGTGTTIDGGAATVAGNGKAGNSPESSTGAMPSPLRTAAAVAAEAASGVVEALRPENHVAAGLGDCNCQGLSGTAVDAGVASGVDLFHESV